MNGLYIYCQNPDCPEKGYVGGCGCMSCGWKNEYPSESEPEPELEVATLTLVITEEHPLPVQYCCGQRYDVEFDIMERPFIRDKDDPEDIYYIEDLVHQHIQFEIVKE